MIKRQKIKGFCHQCRAPRAFQPTYAHAEMQMVSAIGTSKKVPVHSRTRYEGMCTKGHVSEFDLILPPQPRRYRREIGEGLLRGHRDVFAKAAYLERREHFRDLEREAHYAPGHECNEDCPEFEYPEW